MCGIVGAAASWLSESERDRFRELMIVSNLRGFNGAGVIGANNPCDNIRVVKTIGSGIDAAYCEDYRNKIGAHKPTSVLIGHTRWPTKGAVNLEATHPHVHDEIYGVHNGTIRTIMGEHIKHGESDSAKLYELIALAGVDEVIPEVDGAYALVWIDGKEKTLNFLRNEERPLWFATAEHDTCCWWASEKSMLQFVLGRAGKKHTLSELKPNVHIKIEMPLATGNVSKWVRESKELKGYQKPVREVTGEGPFHGQFASWQGRHHYGNYSTKTQQETKEASKTEEPGKKVVTLPVVPSMNREPTKRWSDVARDWVDKTKTEEEVRHQLGGGNDNKTTSTSSYQSSADSTDNTSQQKKQTREVLHRLEDHLREIHSTTSTTGTGQCDGVEEEDDTFVETEKNHWMEKSRVKRILKVDGCAWCGASHEYDDIGTVQWVGPDAFVCDSCSSDAWNVDYINSSFGANIRCTAEVA